MVESCMLGYFGLSSVSCSVVQWGVTRSASTATKISRYTEQIVCPNNATQTMQNETWCPHTHTHAHCCPTSEHLLKFCTLKFMLKEKCTCLLKHSGRAVKWRLLLFWSHDLSVFLKSTGKHHTHIPLSRLMLTHTHKTQAAGHAHTCSCCSAYKAATFSPKPGTDPFTHNLSKIFTNTHTELL